MADGVGGCGDGGQRLEDLLGEVEDSLREICARLPAGVSPAAISVVVIAVPPGLAPGAPTKIGGTTVIHKSLAETYDREQMHAWARQVSRDFWTTAGPQSGH